MKQNTKLMRVPTDFKDTVENLSKQYGYKCYTSFLTNEATPLLKKADFMTATFGFVRGFKKKEPKK